MICSAGDGVVASFYVPENENGSFTDFPLKVTDSFMVLKQHKLCEHSSYCGGEERQFHRGANGYTRHITCKDCDKSGVILARRKEPAQLWAYLVQVALCTKWGRVARSRELAASVAHHTTKALTDGYAPPAISPPPKSAAAARPSPSRASVATASNATDEWDVISAASPPRAPPVARIVYENQLEAWLYGVHLTVDKELPVFPELAEADLPILQPLPGDSDVLQFGPAAGFSFCQISSSVEFNGYCTEALQMALANRPLTPETYRLAFYLYGKLRLAHSAALRIVKSSDVRKRIELAKRPLSAGDMMTSRCIQVPLQTSPDPRSAVEHFCEVMMVEEEEKAGEIESVYALSESDPPGLAILDSGCTRTMHGESWSSSFEKALAVFSLKPKIRQKKQRFREVGGDTTSSTVKIFPIGIGGVHGELHSAETPGETPLLLSRPFMEKLGAVINLKDGTVSFQDLGVKDLPLIRTSRGHMAIDLLNFDRDQLEHFVDFKNDMTDAESYAASEVSNLSAKMRDLSPQPLPSDAADSDCGPPDSPMSAGEWHAVMRQEVEGYEQHMRELGLPAYPHLQQDDSVVCEEVEEFEALLAEGQFTIRKTTTRKGKKLDKMCNNLDAFDLESKLVLQDRRHPCVRRKPPFGRCWIKQLFAGQMGLSLLAIMFGMCIGVPLDVTSSGWNACEKGALQWVNHDMQIEDPYVTVVTHPRGPWGNWSQFNVSRGGAAADTVLQLREEHRPILKLVNRVVVDRVKAKRHIFIEQPYGASSIEEPEMKDGRALIEDGQLVMWKVDGCCVGYKDRESGLPHLKPSVYITSMLAAESVFSCTTCSCPRHEPLEGRNKFGSRTAQAAEWPDALNLLVIETVIQQAHVEDVVLKQARDLTTEDALATRPAEDEPPGQPPRRRRRRQGRAIVLTDQYQAPPVYVRADASGDLPAIADADELPPGEDDQGARAQQVQELDPILNKSEGIRRAEWLEVDAELRKVLRDLHVQFGHPTAATLQRILRRQGAKPEVVKADGLMACDACGESIRRRRPRPVRLPNKYEFNRHILLDTLYAKDVEGNTFGFLNIVDDATSFQVVSCFGQVTGPPSSRAVLRHFTTAWSSWAGLPSSLQVDRGKEYVAIFAT